MGIKEEMKDKGARDRHLHKINAHRTFHKKNVPFTYTMGEYEITVIDVSIEALKLGEYKQLLRFDLSAKRNGNPLDLRKQNPYYFYNPPVCIRNESGESIEDLLQATKEMLYDAVRVSIKDV